MEHQDALATYNSLKKQKDFAFIVCTHGHQHEAIGRILKPCQISVVTGVHFVCLT